MRLVEILLCGIGLLLLLPVTVLFAEIVSAVTQRRYPATQSGNRPRVAVVMPAHNEESLITSALRSIVPQLSSSDRLVVVADNCVDNTPTIARAEGAEVIERADLARRGKGYALDFGVRHLVSDAPDVVIFVDADCRVDVHAIDRLARICAKTQRPVQALYLMQADKSASPLMRIAEFAWAVKNYARPAGLHRWGLPCQLMGTGMAFPWSYISKASLATGHIVEDLKLGIDLARSGVPPLFCPDALVRSEFPVSLAGIQSQRARWEHGYIGVILTEGPSLFLDALVTGNAKMLALALDLSVPPLALLTLLVAIVWFASAVFYVTTWIRLPVIIASTAAALIAISVFLSWQRYGRRIISLSGLALAIVYAIRKVPLYAKFLVSRQLDWVRSRRNEDGP